MLFKDYCIHHLSVMGEGSQIEERSRQEISIQQKNISNIKEKMPVRSKKKRVLFRDKRINCEDMKKRCDHILF